MNQHKPSILSPSITHRFEIGNASIGLYATAKTAALAECLMRQLLIECPDEPATLHDRLARQGSIETSVYTIRIFTAHDGQSAYQYSCVSTQYKSMGALKGLPWHSTERN